MLGHLARKRRVSQTSTLNFYRVSLSRVSRIQETNGILLSAFNEGDMTKVTLTRMTAALNDVRVLREKEMGHENPNLSGAAR